MQFEVFQTTKVSVLYLIKHMKSAEELLKETVFIVECNSFEQHCLWAQHATESPHYPDYPKVKWEQMYGWLIQVGKLAKRPVCISVQFVKIDGYIVMFWYECSQVADLVQTEKWLEKHFTRKWDKGTRYASIDAMNFGHCLSAIKELQKEAA